MLLSNKELANYYDLTDGECAYLQAFDNKGDYKLQQKLEEAYNKMPAERTRFDKDLLKLDEQINIFHQLINYQMLNLFPKEDDPNHKWYAPGDDLSEFAGKDSMFVSRIMGWYLAEVQDALQGGDWSKANEVIDMISTYQQAKNKTLDISPKKIETELKYNKMDVFRQCKKGYLILGGLMLVLSFAMLFKQQKWDEGRSLDNGNRRVGRISFYICTAWGCVGILPDMRRGVTRMKQWYMLPGRQSWQVCCL